LESTFTMIKPDGVRKNLTGEIISRFEKRGLLIEGMRLERLSKETANVHYGEHKGKAFFQELVDFVTSGPVVLLKISGIEGTVDIVRSMIGATNPAEAASGTIRGDFATEISENIIHGSDSLESAARELDLFFR